MIHLKFQKPPVGLLLKVWGTDSSSGAKRRKRFLMRVGIVVGVLSILPSISVKANSLSYQDPQYEDGIPSDIRIYCELVGEEFNICPELLEAMAYNESRFIPTVTNGKHYGLLQINVKVHEERIAKYGWTADDMFDPYKNIMVAADLLYELYQTYGDENPIVLSIYSGNWKGVEEYKEYGHMSKYVQTVLERSAEYERIHNK